MDVIKPFYNNAKFVSQLLAIIITHKDWLSEYSGYKSVVYTWNEKKKKKIFF